MSHLSSAIPTALPVRHEIASLIARLKGIEPPIVSLYVDAHADTDPNAPAQRVDAVLRQLPLERDAREAIERRAGEALRDASEGTLAFFSADDPDAFSTWRFLRVAPDLETLEGAAVARRGVAWVEPLETLLDREAPVVAVFADERRARVFVHDLGETGEASAYVRAMDPSRWRRYQEAETGMPGQAARGGSGKDDFEARKEAWTKRFVHGVVGRIETALATRPGTRLVLLGDARRRSQIEDALSAPLRDAVLASTTAPVDPDLDASRWAEPLGALIRDALDAEAEARRSAHAQPA